MKHRTAIWELDPSSTTRRICQRVKIPNVGDVMRAPSGLLRIVRAVSISGITPGLRKVHIYFVIKHCSWTKRPVTCYSYGELLCAGYRLTRGHVDLKLPSDELIAEECKMDRDKPLLSCCDVEGIA